MITDELKEELVELANEIALEAIHYFKLAAEKSGLILTSELLNSFEHHVNHQAGRLALDVDIHFAGYGRLKDMQQLNYLHLPKVDELEKYVTHVGVDKFPWVNRFGRKQVPTTTSDARHIAWAIAMHKKKVGDVRRKKKFYNRTKVDFVNTMRRRIMDTAQPLILRALKEQAEGG